MQIETFVSGKMQENGYVLWNDAGEAVLIDPGFTTEQEFNGLAAFIDGRGLKPLAILVTHPHFDHIAGVDAVSNRYGIECWINGEDEALLEKNDFFSNMYGSHLETKVNFKKFSPDVKVLDFGKISLQVLPISGHTAGSVAFYSPEAKALFAGDTLTKGSLGFLETGYGVVLECIKEMILCLPDDTVIHYGHGVASSIGEEKKNNRFFKRSAAL